MSADFDAAKALFVEGNAHFEGRRFAQAEGCFRASLALLPGRVSTLANLAATLIALQRDAEALDAAGQALAVAPDDVQALAQRGLALNHLQRPQEAIAVLDRLVALAPQWPLAWLHHAQTLQLLGRLKAAVASYDRCLALDPQLGDAWGQRGGALKDLGDVQGAVASFEQAIAAGADAAFYAYCLAGSRPGPLPPPAAPRGFVQRLFGAYAEGFDEHLVQGLGYRVPQALAALPGPGRRWRSALDLGCGTGLCGEAFAGRVQRLVGLDLSSAMLARAAARGRYAELLQAELVEHLVQTPAQYELLLAADVFIYVGDLDPVLAAASRVLHPGGDLLFSLEAGDHVEPYRLQASLRYSHSAAALRAQAVRHGLVVQEVVPATLREEQRHPVAGWLVWLQRPGRP